MASELDPKEDIKAYLKYGGFGRLLEEEPLWKQKFNRDYRADFYLPDQSPACVIEYDGMHGAGHRSLAGIMRDQWKANLAQLLGVTYFRFNAKTINSGEAYWLLDQVLRKVNETQPHV